MSRVFPDEWLQELINKNDIVDVVSSYVDLKPKGSRHWGCCPFHNEKTASFNVDANKQFFYCFGCHSGGTVIQFIMKIENLSFPEAVEFLANRVSMELPKQTNSKDEQIRQQAKKQHIKIHTSAAKFYYENLVKDKKEAVAYCIKRGLTGNVIKRFGIGYAKNEFSSLTDYLKTQGFSEKQILDSGLARKKDGKIFDFFRNRLMFPIIDIYGNVIAFGGRVLDDSLPKYLNSSDSPMYNKKRHLYGLNIVKKDKRVDRIILVEGYMDVVTLSSYGIKGAVASLGTALTKQQCNLIKRFTTNVYIAYDGDSAGQKAALRAIELLKEVNILPKILVFRKGLDPDEFLKKYGEDEFEKLISKAVMPYKFEVNCLLNEYDLAKEDDRREFAIKALNLLKTVENELDKEDMIKYIQVKTGYSKDVLIRQVTSEKNEPELEIRKISNKKDTLVERAQKHIIKLALSNIKDEDLNKIDEDLFSDEINRKIFLLIKSGIKDRINLVNSLETEDEVKALMEIINLPEEVNTDKALLDCIETIKRSKRKREILELEKQLQNEGISKEERIQILTKINQLQINLKQN